MIEAIEVFGIDVNAAPADCSNRLLCMAAVLGTAGTALAQENVHGRRLPEVLTATLNSAVPAETRLEANCVVTRVIDAIAPSPEL